jgi:hypothetical protein
MAAAAIITHAVTTKPCSILSVITPNPQDHDPDLG